ncbi:MAG: hypothetical protein Q9166_002931 [cf. Caloplaca sp. 2 TL-2023]
MGSHPTPHWFLVRPDRTITPLIAVDELPSGVRIAGVPAVISLIDTKSMESVGVRERSISRYDVKLATSSHDGSSSEEHATISAGSGSDLCSKNPGRVSESGFEQGLDDGMKAMPVKPDESEPVQPQDPETGREQAHETTGITLSHLGDEETANVEKWRQDVETPDETQAKIDALLAATELAQAEAGSVLKDENPLADRVKSGLIPGKKVYCSHWIRYGDCDFVQQGCMYKHEMPDDDTLKAIGVRALPSWYIAAHPEKARERRWGTSRKAGGAPFRTGRAIPAPVPNPAFASARMPLNPPFQPTRFVVNNTDTRSSFFQNPAPPWPNFARSPFMPQSEQYPTFPRVQELSESQYQQWQNNAQTRPNELQIVRKPYRTPGYKTRPFKAPDLVPSPASTEPVPVWQPRQSKLTKGLASHEEDSTSSQGQKVEANGTKPHSSDNSTLNRQSSKQRVDVHLTTTSVSSPPNVHHVIPSTLSTSPLLATNTGFAPLKPSAPPGPAPPGESARQRNPKVFTDLFDLAPVVTPQAARQMFTSTSREDHSLGSKTSELTQRERSATRKDGQNMGRHGVSSSKESQVYPKNDRERREKVLDDKGKPKSKRAAKDRSPSSELLLDCEG